MVPVPRPTRCAALGLDAAFLRRVRDAGVAAGLRLDPVATVRDPAVAVADALLLATTHVPVDAVVAEALAAGARVIVACVSHGDAVGGARSLGAGAEDAISPRTSGAEVAARIVTAVARNRRTRDLETALRLAADAGADAPVTNVRIVGQSSVIQRLRRVIAQVAGAEVPVRIEGERGTGRALAARFVHSVSARRDRPLLVVDAARSGPSVAHALLFGGPGEGRGAIRAASDGTVLVRSVERLEPAAQARLAHWIRTRRTGDPADAGEAAGDDTSGARLLVTVEGSLDAPDTAGRVRPELVAALSSVRVGMPPLRERPGDAAVLLAHFLRGPDVPDVPRAPPVLADGVRRALDAHRWPGNVTELRAVASLLSLRGPVDSIDEATLAPLLECERRSASEGRDRGSANSRLDDGPANVGSANVGSANVGSANDGALAGVASLRDVELGHIVRVLELAGGVRSRAAKALGISTRTIYNHLGGRSAGGPPRRRGATP